MGKHTPGPWKVTPGGIAATAPGGASGLVLARFAPIGRAKEESIANAVLAAAAPDMLAALRLAREAIATGKTTGIAGFLDGIIAKAEG